MTDNNTPAPSTARSSTARRWGQRGIQLLLIVAVFMIVSAWRASPLAEGTAPPLSGKLARGGTADLAQMRGEPVLVHFWATWCPVCRMGDQDIDAIADDHRVISVAMQSGGPREIAAHMNKEGLGFRAIVDEYGEFASLWGVQGVPASFVVDAEGQIRYATMGYTTETGLRGRLWAAERFAGAVSASDSTD